MVQTNFLQSLGWAILNSLWQLAFLWVLYQVITGIYKTARSSFKSQLASALLISGFIWFIYTFFSTLLRANPGSVASSIFVNPGSNESINDWLQKTLPVASIIYLVLLIFPLLRFIRNYRYVQVIRRFGLSKIDVNWRMFVNKLAEQMNIRKKVSIWVSEFVSSPVTIGYLKPIILVPLAAINHLTPQQLEAVLLHELSHIRRMDYLVNMLINIIQSVLYFNPFVKGFVKIIEREREKSCDEMVLQFQYNAHEYATALLTLEQANQPNRIFILGAAGKKTDLLHRVEKIMGVNQNRVFSFQKLAGLMSGLLCVIALQALLLFVNSKNGNSFASFATLSPKQLTPNTQENRRNIKNGPADQPLAAHYSRNLAETRNPELEAASFAPTSEDFIQANLAFSVIPELTKFQEAQKDQALEAVRKVIEIGQWKKAEKLMADAFTQNEKEIVKASIDKKVKKLNLKKLDDKISLAINLIDWEQVKAKVALVNDEYKKDSTKQVLQKAYVKLNEVAEELKAKEMNNIPDTDISLDKLENKKAELTQAMTELRTPRVKKIVRL